MFLRTSAILIQKFKHRLALSLSTLTPPPDPKTPTFSAEYSNFLENPEPETKSPQEAESKPLSPIDLSKAPYELFCQIDIRVGNITECWKHPESENLYCEKIDIGESSVREIGSGLQKHIPISDMSGLVLVIANLKPRKLAGFTSNGMVMALHTNTGFELVRPLNTQIGERVGLEGVLDPPGKTGILANMNPKKKVFENSAGFFVTDNDGFACFGLKRLLTSAGFIRTAHGNSKIS